MLLYDDNAVVGYFGVDLLVGSNCGLGLEKKNLNNVSWKNLSPSDIIKCSRVSAQCKLRYICQV